MMVLYNLLILVNKAQINIFQIKFVDIGQTDFSDKNQTELSSS